MNKTLLQKSARIIVAVCTAVKANETVLIVSDSKTEACADLLAEAARSTGAVVTVAAMPPRKVDGQEPTAAVAAAMKKAGVILLPVQKSLAHTSAVKEALAAGARVLSLTALSQNLMLSDAFSADFKKERPLCERVARLLTRASTLTITTAAGTRLTVSVKGRKGNAHCCLVDRPGQFSSAPNIEANISPIEGSMEGTFVADASIPYLDIGLLSEPVIFEIKQGMVVSTAGGPVAETLNRIWQAQKDPAVYNIAQVAVGLNPKIKKPVGILGCNYDEGAYGTAHIGIGTSINLGGRIKASTHFDALMHKPTIRADETVILKNGRLLA
ncbi:MAG: hypothetical protein P1P89_21510 [Desulfobacterales bacterium]|nr:hypothetical protein [Desulfobacterales bacterium]